MIFKNCNTEIYYEVYGEGDPVLLIAGLASDSVSWGTVTHEMAKNHRVIVFDNRYSGRTKTIESELTINMMAQDAKKLLDYLNIEKVNVIGHSMGGLIALELSTLFPNRIKKVIAAACPYEISCRNRKLFKSWEELKRKEIPDRLWFENLFYWILTSAFFEDKELLKTALDFSESYPYNQTADAFSKQIQALNNFDFGESLNAIDANVLIIAAEKDILIPVEECRRLAESIKNSHFLIIPDAAHSIHSEKPGEFVNSILEFLKE